MQPITSIAALWQEATTDPEFGFALKAQSVRVDLTTSVAITTPEPTGEAVKTRPPGNTIKEKTDEPEICPGCGEGHLIRYIEREQVESNGQTWRTPLHFSECDACGAELTNAEQSRANVEAMKKIELKAKLHASKQLGSDPNLPKT